MADFDPFERVTMHAVRRYNERVCETANRSEIVSILWTAAVRRSVIETDGTQRRVVVRVGPAKVFVIGGYVVTLVAADRNAYKTRHYVSDRERRPNGWKHRALRDLYVEGVS